MSVKFGNYFDILWLQRQAVHVSRSALRETLVRWLRRLGPWAVAAGLLTWVFSRVPLHALGQAMRQGEFGWFLPVMACIMACIFLADCLAISKTFTWFTAPFPYREVLPIRGASYLLSVINYNLGQGALVLFVKRARGIRLGLSTGTVLLMMGINLVILLILAAVGLGISQEPLASFLWPWILGLLGAFVIYLVVVAVKPRLLTRYDVFKPLFRAGVLGHLAAMAVRVPHLACIFTAHYLALRAFGVHLPLYDFLAFMPVLSLLSALPISPQGLGTHQVASIYFFARFAPGTPAQQEATVLAYSITIMGLATLFMLVMGGLWFRSGMRLLGLRGSLSESEKEGTTGTDGTDGVSAPASRRTP